MTPPYVLWRTDAEPVVLLRDVPLLVEQDAAVPCEDEQGVPE